MIVQQPYRPVTYTIGSVSSGTMGTSNSMAPMGTMGAMGGTMQAVPPQVTSGSPMTPSGTVVSAPAPVFEQSYIENILRLNLGKVGTFYMTYENNKDWNAKIFKGKLEAAGRDHIIISDPTTGQRIMLLMINFDYATFDEPLTYQYPGVIGNPGTRYYR
ncbi:spore coat protein GerQ [Bacillus sp. FJAT-27264]|uniref:spore coat protein GerQ n=1 Tax=Paenibacillus sp. (strain DSM 101736 / FJAT-27264) TaxID=1850362 RepID=UPI000807DB1A|nr:spore coat protein GerQ [Bacillus sp. FJAT-27264]OBZ18076.1 spore coat protein GerQ [Bacillus sp. FJAT-27264]